MQMKFEVYFLDMYCEEGEFIENDRFRLGTLTVDPVIGEPDDADILNAMCDFTFCDIINRRVNAIDREHIKDFYIDHGFGDEWLEICLSKTDWPLYGLRLIEFGSSTADY